MDRDFLCNSPELEPLVLSDVRVTGAGNFGREEKVTLTLGAVATQIRGVDFDISDDETRRTFVRECQLLTSLRHPNVVRFLGLCYFPDTQLPALVVERMLTDLHDLLGTRQLSLSLKCCLLHNIARGLEYLHQQSPPIIHCNLSARSILLNTRLVAKIADLDMACVIPDLSAKAIMSKVHETSTYTPPETSIRNASIDIFSFGVISIFTLSQTFPYKTLLSLYYDMESRSFKSRTELERRHDSMEGVKTKLSACGTVCMDHPLIQMIHKCMRDAPTERPHILEVLRLIELAKTNIMDQEITRNEVETLQVLEHSSRVIVPQNVDLQTGKRKSRVADLLRIEKGELPLITKQKEAELNKAKEIIEKKQQQLLEMRQKLMEKDQLLLAKQAEMQQKIGNLQKEAEQNMAKQQQLWRQKLMEKDKLLLAKHKYQAEMQQKRRNLLMSSKAKLQQYAPEMEEQAISKGPGGRDENMGGNGGNVEQRKTTSSSSWENLKERFKLHEKRGLAILVTCDYASSAEIPTLTDVHKVAEGMRKTFDQFEYDVHQYPDEKTQKNATKEELTKVLEDVSHYLKLYDGEGANPDGQEKVIVFAFAGHGTSNGFNDDRIQMNDGKEINLKCEVWLPLVRHPRVYEIPKLFFIDAFRGSEHLEADEFRLDKGFADEETNYRIDFATIEDYVAYANPQNGQSVGSAWMPELAKQLVAADDTFATVIENVNRTVYKQMDDGNRRLQQPESVDVLHTASLKLFYNGPRSDLPTDRLDEHRNPKIFLKEKRGLAILVTCAYRDPNIDREKYRPLPQTDEDAKQLRMMFEMFDYDIHQLPNGNKDATKNNIIELLSRISKYLSDYPDNGESKVVIFAFSGHGTSCGDYKDQIIANDGEELWLKRDIVLPLVQHPKSTKIPKLFLIDACRGSDQLKYKRVEKGIAEVDTNYRIDYASVPDPTSSPSGFESMWMPTLASKLRERDDTLANVVDEVNALVYKEEHPDQLNKPNQLNDAERFQNLYRLHTGPLKMYHQAKPGEMQQPAPQVTYTCDISGPGLKSVANNETYILVELKDQNGSLCKQKVTVTVTLKCIANPNSPSTKESQPLSSGFLSLSRYPVWFTIVNHGRHELNIQLNGAEIKENPFLLTTYPDPTKLSSPEMDMPIFNDPYGIAFNNSGQIIISECDSHQLSIVDKEKQTPIRTIGALGSHGDNPEQMMFPKGIAIDEGDNIYVTSEHKLQVFTSTGELIKSVGQKGSDDGEFADPRGVTLYKKEVYVCDCDNHRIQVFDRDLCFIKSFGSRGKGKNEFDAPMDVKFDTSGNMYVAELGNARVQVMNSAHEFKEFLTEKMFRPSALYIIDRFIYISDLGREEHGEHGHCIVVYNTTYNFSCNFVISFGDLQSPYCISSADGFIYICDLCNNKVLKY